MSIGNNVLTLSSSSNRLSNTNLYFEFQLNSRALRQLTLHFQSIYSFRVLSRMSSYIYFSFLCFLFGFSLGYLWLGPELSLIRLSRSAFKENETRNGIIRTCHEFQTRTKTEREKWKRKKKQNTERKKAQWNEKPMWPFQMVSKCPISMSMLVV